MSEENSNVTDASPASKLPHRILSGVLSMAALGAAAYLANAGLDMATATTASALVRDHAPAVVGLPVLIALATAIVCGARALDPCLTVEFLGLRAQGGGATVLSWVLVFSSLVVALRALW